MTSQNHPYKAALVTGAGVRIGRSVALALAESGLAVAVHYRKSATDAESLVQQIRDAGGAAATVRCDLNDPDALSGLVENAASLLEQPIDVLVNNASIFEQDDLLSLDHKNWDRHQNINLKAPVLLSQALARQLPEDAKGCIVNMIDQRVLKLNPQYFSYTASKAGLWTVTRTMAQALAPRIRVNGIGPGPTLANQFQSVDDFKQEAARVLLGEGPDLQEFVAAVKFLLETPSITGQMIALDGGQHLAWRTPDILED